MSSMSLKELIAQREALEKQISERRAQERAEVIAKVRQLVADHELNADDIFGKKGRGSSGAKTGAKVAAKYRDPETGATWTGRGKPPTWIKDVQDRSVFEIKD